MISPFPPFQGIASLRFYSLKSRLFTYLDSFEPFPTPVPFQSLDSIPTYKNDINESGIT